jgi:hypothetical protein
MFRKYPFCLYHPYFWSSVDRISFIKSFYQQCKTNKIDVSGYLYLPWTGRISTLKHEEPVLYNIFDYQNLSGKKPYVDGIDIARYFNAVYSHYNDICYQGIRRVQVHCLLFHYFVTKVFGISEFQLLLIFFY